MAGLIISQYSTPKYSIKLQTSEGNDIDNMQRREAFNTKALADASHLEKRYSLAKHKGEVCSIYNCHGLSFASRRTWIFDSAEIEKILRDDKYFEIKSERDVLPGDMITYLDNTGYIHSGLVLSVKLPETENDLVSISVLSKWGAFKEVIHNANDCPYIGIKKYWRINYGFTIV